MVLFLLYFEILILEILIQGAIRLAVAFGDILGLSGRGPRSGERPHLVLIGIALVFLGAVVGVLATWPFPGPVLPELWMRVAGIFVFPLLAGVLTGVLGRWIRAGGGRPTALATFRGGFVLVFAAAVLRFAIVE